MIKTENGTTNFKGNVAELVTDLTVIHRQFKSLLRNAGYDEKQITGYLNQAVIYSSLTDEEIEKLSKENDKQ